MNNGFKKIRLLKLEIFTFEFLISKYGEMNERKNKFGMFFVLFFLELKLVLLCRYKLLEEFFGGLVSSIRLLQLKGSSTTFTNISAKVECLTDRYANDEHLCMH